jgi:hypothetical protein
MRTLFEARDTSILGPHSSDTPLTLVAPSQAAHDGILNRNIVRLTRLFPNSKHIFVGEVVDISGIIREIKDKKDRFVSGSIKFRIERWWKGPEAGEISLPSDVLSLLCGDLIRFEEGKKYLVFAGRDHAASYNSTPIKQASSTISRPDNFWFRVWASIYPF